MKILFKKTLLLFLILVASLLCVFGTMNISEVSAETEEELKSKIDTKSDEIKKLEEEINKYNRDIINVQAESKTLSSSIRELDLTAEKLLTEMDITNNKIASANYSLQKTQTEIDNATYKINKGNNAIGDIVRSIDESETKTLIEVVLENNEFSDFWNDIESMQNLRNVITSNLKELESLKNDLQNKQAEKEKEKESLLEFESQLKDQKQVIEVNKKDKNSLLSQTENKEANYQKIVNKKKAAKDAFEKELADFESQLKTVINQNLLPSFGSGVLGWPLADLSLGSCYVGNNLKFKNCVTQFFGNTDFSKSGAYNGQGHNGIDFRAAVGDTLYASADGTIAGTGNTDQYSGCYSYGKWVLITHDNGLSSLYAHLSLIKVQSGQYVHKGDIIGYTGNTGYSTGPHLHYGVYASEGVSIVRMGDVKKITNCTNAYIPVASYSAYLNPIDYLSSSK